MFYLIYEWYRKLPNPDPDSVLRFLRLLKPQPFRAMCAAATAFLVVFLVMPWFIRLMRRKGVSEQARHYSELDSGRKSEVPTMGGLVFFAAIVVSALLWCDPTSGFVWIAMVVGLCGGALGMVDDLAKLRHKGSDHGLSRTAKYAAQIALGLLLAAVLVSSITSPVAPEVRTSVYLPFHKYGLDIGLANVALITLFIVFSTNSVNLTDGMDGLAAVPSIMVFLVLAVFAYIIGHVEHAKFLQFFPYLDPKSGAFDNHALPGAGELAVLCCAGAGAVAGFLWYNAFPATVMMGDTGALGLGALLGAVAVLVRQEVVFIIAGGVFVIELMSTFIQDYIGLKLLGRRIFFRAPFHSSMLHRGISENKVTVRFWVLSAALAVAALAMLKLR
jgi:phospho-N-acetylmuramoyl-pentapeptide-transferase